MFERIHWKACGDARRLVGLRLLSVFLPVLLLFGGSLAPLPAQANGASTSCAPMPPFGSPHDRFGVDVVRDYGKTAADYNLAQTRVGWYLDYRTVESAHAGVAYVRILRVEDLVLNDWQSRVEASVSASPGAIWFVGNEPDRYSQDGIPADEYARIYHRTYHLIKQLDPTATVGNAAVIQATPIRLRYLDEFVRAYQRLYHRRPPVDYWNIHNFVLREEIGVEGASIPPGLEAFADEGKLFEVWQHGDFELFKSQIIVFRQWMADNDYRNVPLTVSEYGILMPADYFAEPPLGDGSFPPDAQRYDHPFVRDYMLASFDFFLNYTDPAIGYPQDGNRLVQSWAWYSLNDKEYDPDTQRGYNGNWMDHDTGVLTPLGQDVAAYIAPLYHDYRDLTARRVQVAPTAVTDPGNPGAIQIEVLIQNRGTLPANNATVRLYWGARNRVLIGERTVRTVTARCAQMHIVRFTWRPDSLPLGQQAIVAEVVPASGQDEGITGNEVAITTLRVGGPGTFPELFLPVAMQ